MAAALAAFLVGSKFANHVADAPYANCTTAIITTADGPIPPTTWEPTWTITEWPSTTTERGVVDCHGCAALTTATLEVDYIYPAGPEPVLSTMTMPTPTTVTNFKCIESSGAPMPPNTAHVPLAPRAPAAKIVGRPKATGRDADQECTSTRFVVPQFTYGPTKTVWAETTTETSTVDCGACAKVSLTTRNIGVGPVAVFTTTITAAEPSTTTSYVCSPEAHMRHFSLPVEDVFASRKARGLPHNTTVTTSTSAYTSAPDQYATSTAVPPNVAEPSCTRSTAVHPTVPNAVSTTFSATLTQTNVVDCGSCALEWSTDVLFFFAPIVYTSTFTALTPSTKTDFACSPTPP